LSAFPRLFLAPLEVFAQRGSQTLGPRVGLALISVCHAQCLRLWSPYGKGSPHSIQGFARLCIAAPPARCRSSVVEHSLGKGEVDSSILSGSTSLSRSLAVSGPADAIHPVKRALA
jgi:hypothetical protein